MADKRKLAEDTPVDDVAPEGKKMKKEKKDKKDKKDKKEKKEKKEKRKAEKAVEAAAATTSVTEEKEEKEQVAKSDSTKAEKKEKKDKKDNKDKKEKKEEKKKRDTETAELDDESNVAEKATKKAKHDKKKKKKQVTEDAGENVKENGDGNADEEMADADGEHQSSSKNSRFICFVGNLPYSANLESLTKHFEKNPPASIRVATKKEAPTKCRGFAFIEFDNYDRMKTCLKLYHHSMFDDGKYPPRRINVELTAGGGGSNSEHRKAKIVAKNQKLNEERHRQAKDVKKDKNRHDKGKPGRSDATASDANAVVVDAENDRFAGMHPSRRGRI